VYRKLVILPTTTLQPFTYIPTAKFKKKKKKNITTIHIYIPTAELKKEKKKHSTVIGYIKYK